MSNYIDTVRKIIAESAGVEVREVTPDSYFEEDLNVGGMDLVEILSEIEEALHVDLIEQKDDIESVQDLLDIISEKIE